MLRRARHSLAPSGRLLDTTPGAGSGAGSAALGVLCSDRLRAFAAEPVGLADAALAEVLGTTPIGSDHGALHADRPAPARGLAAGSARFSRPVEQNPRIAAAQPIAASPPRPTSTNSVRPYAAGTAVIAESSMTAPRRPVAGSVPGQPIGRSAPHDEMHCDGPGWTHLAAIGAATVVRVPAVGPAVGPDSAAVDSTLDRPFALPNRHATAPVSPRAEAMEPDLRRGPSSGPEPTSSPDAAPGRPVLGHPGSASSQLARLARMWNDPTPDESSAVRTGISHGEPDAPRSEQQIGLGAAIDRTRTRSAAHSASRSPEASTMAGHGPGFDPSAGRLLGGFATSGSDAEFGTDVDRGRARFAALLEEVLLAEARADGVEVRP